MNNLQARGLTEPSERNLDMLQGMTFSSAQGYCIFVSFLRIFTYYLYQKE